jgi:hypothetical protein
MGVFDKLFRRKRSSSRSAADSPNARPENLAFLQAMEAVARSDSPENRRELYRTMLQAWFLVPTNQIPDPGTAGKHVVGGDTRVSIPIHRDAKGKNIVPAFTDEQALAQWSGASPWFALQGLIFFQGVAETEADEIAVNPFRPGEKMIRPHGRITRTEFQALSGQDYESDDRENATRARRHARGNAAQRSFRRASFRGRIATRHSSPLFLSD